jgi:hypothetical protein
MKQFENMSLNANETEVLSNDLEGMSNEFQDSNLEESSVQEGCHSCELETCEEIALIDEVETCEAELTEGLETCEVVAVTERKEAHVEPKKEKKNSSHYDLFLSEYEKTEGAELKLQMTMDFMELSLAQAGSPHFKSFWDARNICLELFKENISQNLRAQMWGKYTELSKEARRLKEILDEQSSFAAEQIEIAIKALETDLEQTEQNLEKSQPVDFGVNAESFGDKYSFYENMQRQLNLLNTQASRINALRKELIRTEMRIKVKNKFFQRLSAIGDKVFPQRKDLIKDVSAQFSSDIDAFIEEYFAENKIEDALFFLREEIKALQGLAKLLTLNTHSFTHTRMRLSDCWDKLKGVEKERKKERAQQKIYYKQNVDSVLEKIKVYSEAFATGEMTIANANHAMDEISSFMRSVELGRDEVKFLREEIQIARKPLLDKLKAADDERHSQEIEREMQKKKMVEDLKLEVEQLLENTATFDAETIITEQTVILLKINASKLNKLEKNDLEKRLKVLKDIISDKKEQAMMSLSDDDKQALIQLTSVLSQRKERRQEIKNQLEILRKSNRSSGFDFEQAMKNNELINEEKERLDKMDLGVKEIESLISELKRKVKV